METPVDDVKTVPEGPDVNHPDRVTVDKLKVLHDYIVVRPLAVPSKLGGSLIHMVENAAEREKSHRGIVLVTGPGDFNEAGTHLVPMSIEPEDLVFFGKFAGTEERIGADIVLVMREQECRFRVSKGGYQLVTHAANPKANHLIEDYCEICHGIPLEQAAKEQLELQREAHQLALQQVCVCKHLGGRHAHGAGSCHDCECQEFCPDVTGTGIRPGPQTPARVEGLPEFAVPTEVQQIGEANQQLQELWKKGKLQMQTAGLGAPTILSLSDDRRPCVEPGCLLMQRKVVTDYGAQWIGLRCGHVSIPTEV